MVIIQPLQLSESDIILRLQICTDHCDYYREHGQQFRRRHLQNRAEVARTNGNEDGARQILNMIARERQRDYWRQIHTSMSHQSGRSVNLVQVEQEGGEVLEYDTQEGIENAIWTNIHRRRFYLAEEPPICRSTLRTDFGYLANTEAADAVLQGEYIAQEDIDPATLEMS